MAYSQSLSGSVRKGQAAILCQLCENDPKLKWKCLNCKIMMCQRCKDKVHPKFASAEDHTIIDIKEIGQHQTDYEPKPDLTKLKCKVHSGQNCCFYCETCASLVCQTCVTKSHNSHKFKEIIDEYEIRLNKIKNEQKNVEGIIHIQTLHEQKLKQIKLSEQSKYDQVEQDILDYEKALMDELKKHTSTLLKDLDQKWEAVSNSIDSNINQLKEEQRQIHEQQRQINSLLQGDNAKDVFSVFGSILKSIKATIQPLKMSIKGVPKFIYGDKSMILQNQGKFDEVIIKIKSDLEVKAEFQTELTVISSSISCSDGGFWICDRLSNSVQKVEPNKDNLKVKSRIKMKVYDAALFSSGNLLLSIFDSSNLKLIPSGSTRIKDSVYTISELQPTTIHITKDNKIIIGAREKGPTLPVKGPRKVIVMDQTGHEEKVIEYDRHNKPLFTLPFRTTNNSQGNIVVIDWVSDDWRGRVLILDKEGEVRNIFTGHPCVNNEDNPLYPTGITATPSDNFVVTDIYNHSLHILNSEGEIITFYNTEEIGILLPFSLSFSSTGQLYIGCKIHKTSDEKAKLFALKDFLF